MKKLLTAALLALPLAAAAADDHQHRGDDSKRRGGHEMHEHMAMMQDMMTHMRQGERRDLTPDEMRTWIDEHLKRMRQMMSEHGHAMHDGGGMHGGRDVH